MNLDCDRSVYVTCCAHNHNGQLLIAGCSDGTVRTYDLRHSECVDQWQAHKDAILGLQLSSDHTACYTLGADNKVRTYTYVLGTGSRNTYVLIIRNARRLLQLCRRSLNGNNHGPTWDATLCADPLFSHPGHKFTLDQAAKHILLCYGQPCGGTIFKVPYH